MNDDAIEMLSNEIIAMDTMTPEEKKLFGRRYGERLREARARKDRERHETLLNFAVFGTLEALRPHARPSRRRFANVLAKAVR